VKRRIALPAILAVAAVIAVSVALLLPSSAPPPETEFTLLDGRKVTLRSLRGRPVLISFWATTCRPCVEELPDLIRLYNDWHALGFELIAVACPTTPTLRRSSCSAACSRRSTQGKLTSAFGGVYVPAAFFIAPNGNIVSTGRLTPTRHGVSLRNT
jgi:thiol-disulfide isomerase/thioredoxin